MKIGKNNNRIWASYTILALIIGLSLDLINKDLYQNSVMVDILTIVLSVISLILIVSKKAPLSFCFSIAAYALVLDILIPFFLLDSEAARMLHFNRDTVFVAFALTLTAYFVNKYHAFIMSGIYVISLTIFYLFTSSVLLDNSVTIMFAMIAYSFIIFYFVRMQERTLNELNETNNRVIQQNEELLQQQEEITSQRDILARQKKLIESRNSEILEGMRFAKSIQESVLSKESDLEKYFNQYFIISKPKAVISGDFFWIKEWMGCVYLSLVDCTGHGVPGAMVSMLANMYLGRAFIELDKPDPAHILNYISNAITTELRLVDSFHARVGMDIACLKIDFEKMKMDYAAAFTPLYMIRRDNLIQYEASRIMMGNVPSLEQAKFKNEMIDIVKGDRFYLFSDGITDQFGGDVEKKFGFQRLRHSLIDTNHHSMETQKKLFWKKWQDWKAGYFQVDDVLMLGFEI